MFRAISLLVIRSILTVITASGFIHVRRCRLLPTTTHVNKTSSQGTINYSTQLHMVGHFIQKKTVSWCTDPWMLSFVYTFCSYLNVLKTKDKNFIFVWVLYSYYYIFITDILYIYIYIYIYMSVTRMRPQPWLTIYCSCTVLTLHFLIHSLSMDSLTLRLLMSYIYIYIYGAPILDVSRSYTTTQHSR